MLCFFGCGDDAGSGGPGSGGGGVGGSGAGAGSGAGGAAATTSTTSTTGTGTGTGTGTSTGSCADDTDLPLESLGGGADPEAGTFTIEEALADLSEGPGPLRAVLGTDKGELVCTLFPEDAPNAVANFVGLARGRRPWKDPATKEWVKGRRFYDGLLFHRVIDDFMAQGGDPLGTGFGGPGYAFADEISDKSHVPGTLAYANSGPDSNGSQFYVVAEEPAAFLDGDYVIFGLCEPVSVVQALTEVDTDAKDKPLADLHLTQVIITRCAP